MKKYVCLILFSLIFLNIAFGQTEFIEPWKDQTRALVLDPFYKNELDCSKLSQEPRVAAILHKASERLTKDSKYDERKKSCKETYNYKWGSYHLGRHGNPLGQANFYLNAAKPTEDEVMALDLEDSYEKDRTVMSLPEAVIFIRRIKEVTGRYPMLYIPERVRGEILRKYGTNSEFAKTPLWYARYCLNLTGFFPTRFWKTYSLLQFASEINCPTNSSTRDNCPLARQKRCPLGSPIPGTNWEMDVNVYNGTVEELRSKWAELSPHL